MEVETQPLGQGESMTKHQKDEEIERLASESDAMSKFSSAFSKLKRTQKRLSNVLDNDNDGSDLENSLSGDILDDISDIDDEEDGKEQTARRFKTEEEARIVSQEETAMLKAEDEAEALMADKRRKEEEIRAKVVSRARTYVSCIFLYRLYLNKSVWYSL